MATKNKTKTKALKMPKLNRTNFVKFINKIYSENKNGSLTLTPLCVGGLKSDKIHCAIGEVYFDFVNKNMSSVLNVDAGYESKYDSECDSDTSKAIDCIVDIAKLKRSVRKEDFANALDEVVAENDSKSYEDGDVFRSKQVANAFKKHVLPLLK